MPLALSMITVDTRDALPLARWWAEQIGGTIVAENDGWYVVVALTNGLRLSFQKVDDPTPGKNRLHLDLTSGDLDADIARLLAVGATKIVDYEMYGGRWATLADPDGNQFCVAEG